MPQFADVPNGRASDGARALPDPSSQIADSGAPELDAAVERLLSGDPAGVGALLEATSRGARFLLERRNGPATDTAEIVRGVVSGVAQKVLNHQIIGASTVRRAILEGIRAVASPCPTTRRTPFLATRQAVAATLNSLDDLEYDVAHRYYGLEQDRGTICESLGISEARFREIVAGIRSRCLPERAGKSVLKARGTGA